MTSLPNYPAGRTYAISSQGLSNIIHNQHPKKYPGQHVVWTDNVTVELPVRVGVQGLAAQMPVSMLDEWRINLTKFAKDPALSVKRNKQWVTLNYQEYHNESMRFARSLVALGLPEFAAVNLIGFNSPEWAIGFHGSTFARCIPVGIYTTNSKEVCQYIAEHSQTRVVVAENKQLASKYFDLLESGKIWKIVIYNEEIGGDSRGGKLISWDNFMELGRGVDEVIMEERRAKIRPGQCCCMAYTSGTTGMPKGVMISHDNCSWTPKSQQSRSGYPHVENARTVSYLPLSHVAALYFDILMPILKGAHVYFAQPTALQGTLVQTLQEVRPQVFFAVPRVWEKMYTKIKAEQNSKGGIAKNILTMAQSYGIQGSIQEMRGEPTSWQFKLAKKLVFDKVKSALGLDQSLYFGFGAAPIDPAIRRYFLSMNFLLMNAYGMTETTGPHSGTSGTTYNPKSNLDLLEVGVPMPGVETVIKRGRENEDEDGQICMRGRNVMMGYLKNPQQTSRSIDDEGFMHSGDLGKINQHGYLYITGRAKELIITAGGENIPPILIENQIKKALPCLSNVMLIGDQRNFLSCLISLIQDPPNSGKLQKSAAEYLAARGCPVKTVEEAKSHPGFRKVILDGLKQANQKAISRAQTVHSFYLMPEDFSVDNGTLTPSLKLKRNVAAKMYAAEINKMYETPKL